jgi:hypothetical protein
VGARRNRRHCPTLTFPTPDFGAAALVAVVLLEPLAISWIRHRYVDTPPLTAAVQVGSGGALVPDRAADRVVVGAMATASVGLRSRV